MRWEAVAVAASLVACAPPPRAPAAAEAVAEPPEVAMAKAEPLPDPEAIPTTCVSEEPPCVPDATYVKRLCSASYPEVALTLLGKESPFTRMYLRGDVDGWNADGGVSTRAKLAFDEEVLVLKRRPAPVNSVVVGAGGGYLVMRWDGACYTLEENEVTAKRPPVMKHSAIPWRFLSEKGRAALLSSPKINAAFQKRGKECKGASSGEVSRPCEQADAALSAVVVAEVRSGVSIPSPDWRP